MVSIARVQFARESLLRVLNLSSKHHWVPNLSAVSLCEMFSGSPDGLKDSDVLLASLCPQGRICKLGFSRPISSSQLWVSPRRSPGSLREFLLAQSCDCVPWPTGFILAMCFCLLPRHLPCLLPLGPLAPEQQVLALWLLLLMLPHGVCCFLCPPLTAAPAIPTPYLFFFFRRRGTAVGYTVVIAQPDALAVYIQSTVLERDGWRKEMVINDSHCCLCPWAL